MKLHEIKSILEPYIDEPVVNFRIERTLFNNVSGRRTFNQTIRQNVDKKYGVYIWVNELTEEIVYIGMAGKIKTDGTIRDHSIRERLLASRGKDKKTNKDVQTNDFVKSLMVDHDISVLSVCILYSKKGEPPAYLEALLLYKFYKKNNCLPKLNNSF